MANAVAVQLADAIVSQLNTAAITNAPTFRRSHRVYFERKDLAEPKGTVVATAKVIEKQTRTTFAEQYESQIGIQAGLSEQRTNDEIDEWLKTTEGIVDQLRNTVDTTITSATPLTITNDPLFDRDKLEDMAVFFSLITVSYRVFR